MVEWLKINHKIPKYTFPVRKTLAHDLPVLLDPESVHQDDQTLGYCEYRIHLVQQRAEDLIMVELCLDSTLEEDKHLEGMWKKVSVVLAQTLGRPVGVEMWNLSNGTVCVLA